MTRVRGRMNNAFDPSDTAGLDAPTRELVRKRGERLGPAYRLFYAEPVHVVRGLGTRLWDADGNEYLDAYNNVVSVGHAHPRVVAAVAEQMGTLCTHTRYLHDGIVRYAGELLDSLGGEVGAGHAMFTCTGSEANDLALRIARYRTGRDGVIITDEAYHGNSDRTAEISASLGENSPLGTWVRQVRVAHLAEDVRAAAADLHRHGNGVAAFIGDSAFSSAGLYTHDVGLGAAVDSVREAGGLFIADEVQCGFGRLGDGLWGYARHGVDPDIVTLGKPMGNGFPVAGLAVRREVVADFGHDVRYFNTFGGNTVAIAAAQAVFDVIRDEALVENSHRVGAELRAGLVALRERHPDVLGEIRGSGLYVGVDTPDAAPIVNGLRARRVLISATGRAGNTLKIRPPLVFSSDDVALFLDALDAVLAQPND